MDVSFQTVAYSTRYLNSFTKKFITFLMSEGRGPLVITKPVRELLFDGYEDPLLTVLRANGDPSMPKVSSKLIENLQFTHKSRFSLLSIKWVGLWNETDQSYTMVISRYIQEKMI